MENVTEILLQVASKTDPILLPLVQGDSYGMPSLFFSVILENNYQKQMKLASEALPFHVIIVHE
jgi:hypothetical protein